jgi:hypothetical protein
MPLQHQLTAEVSNQGFALFATDTQLIRVAPMNCQLLN